MFRRIIRSGFFIIAFTAVGLIPDKSDAVRYKVLVVMSYHESMPWVQDVKEGIDIEIGGGWNLKYFYMDTKRNMEGGPQKAEEAYALYRKLQPDGVIAVDDNAQSMFVVPYLKDKVETPVIFCGVNSNPDKYGYPASNVTGSLERPHIAGSIAFAQQLVPSIKTFGLIGKDSPTTWSMLKQIQREAETYPAKLTAYKLPKTMNEALTMARELKELCDALLIVNIEGVPGKDGKPMTKKEVVPVLAKTFGKPTITDVAKDLRYGILCAIAVTGQEQGSTAARMLLKAMRGTPVSQIPITQNRQGSAMINVTVMGALGIKPRPIVLKGTELLKTEE